MGPYRRFCGQKDYYGILCGRGVFSISRFFHPEVEGRVPVVIQSNFVDPDIALILYGEPLVVVKDTKRQVITNIYMRFFENGSVSINYPVEGVKGVFKFVHDPKGAGGLDFKGSQHLGRIGRTQCRGKLSVIWQELGQLKG